MDSSALEDSFFDINNLTIIASESYDKFAKELQKEILESLSDRPIVLTTDVLVGRVLRNEKGEEFIFNDRDARKLLNDFEDSGYINENDEITEKLIEDIEQDKMEIPKEIEGFKKEVGELMSKIYLTSELKITSDERRNNIPAFKLTNNFKKKEFQDLWNRIKVKTVYEVDFDSKELIKKVLILLTKN